MKSMGLMVLLAFFSMSTACGFFKNAEDSIAEAKVELQTKKYNSAIVILKDVLQSDGSNAEARFLLGQIYYDIGDYDGAVKELSKAFGFGWKKNNVEYMWLTALRNGNLYEKLGKQLNNSALTSGLKKADVIAFRGWHALGSDQQKEAAALFDESLMLMSNNYDALLGKAQMSMNDRNLSEAEALLQQILVAYPGDAEASILLAMLELAEQKFAASAARLKSVLKNEPQGVVTRRALNARLSLIRVLLIDGHQEEASILITETYRAASNHPLVMYFKGYDLFRLKEYTKSKELLNKVVNRIPGHKPSLLLLGSIHFTEKNYEQASFFLNRYVQSNPKHVGARKMLGAAQLSLNQADDALLTLQPVLNDADLDTLKLAGAASLSSGDFSGGLKFFQLAVNESPDDLSIRVELAKAYLATGENKVAKQELEKALSGKDGNKKAFALLINLQLREKNTQLAINLAEKAAKENPESAYYLNVLGRLYAMDQRFDESKVELEKALINDATYSPAILNLAKVYFSTKQPALAEDEFNKIINDETNHTVVSAYVRFLLSQKREPEAISYLKGITENKDNLQAANMLLQLYKHTGDTAEYDRYLASLGKSENGHILALGVEGRDFLAAGNANDAIRVYRDLLRQNPNSYLGYFDLAKGYLLKKDLPNAVENIKKSLNIHPDFLQGIALLSNLYIEQKEIDKAEALVSDYANRHSASAVGYALKGDVYARTGRFKKAIEQYEKSLSLSENKVMLVLKLSLAYGQTGNDKKRVSLLKEQIELTAGEDYFKVSFELGSHYKNKKQHKKSLAILKKLGSEFEHDPVKLNDLAWVIYPMDIDFASVLAKKAYEKLGSTIAVIDTYGWILLKKGENQKGLALLKEAYEGMPEVDEIAYHYAVALYENGSPEEAKPIFIKLNAGERKFEGKEDINQYIN